LASVEVKKSFAGYAIPESIPTFEANLHRLQFKHTLIAARRNLRIAQQILTTRRADANRIFFGGDDPVFPGMYFCCDAASECSRDFKICLKKEAPRQILKKKATKQVKKMQ
jgi:hypothetical protein